MNVWWMPHVAKDKRQYSPGDIYKTKFLRGGTLICSGIYSVKSQSEVSLFSTLQNSFSHYINSKN